MTAPSLPELEFHAPTSVDEALAVLGRQRNGDARLLAGGTDLLVQMRSGRRQPRVVVDLKRIPELTRIALDADTIRIGAAAPAAAIVEHPELARLVPGLVEAVNLIGSTQIQGRASLGGNVCNGSPAADTVPSLIALGARASVAGPGGARDVDVADIIVAPGETCLAPDEFVVEFGIPVPAPNSGDAYLRLIPRTEMDIAVAGAAVSVTLDPGGVCRAARVALAAVGPTPIEVPEAAAALTGSRVDEDALDALVTACRAASRPIDDLRAPAGYRTQVVGVLAKRAAAIAAERAAAS